MRRLIACCLCALTLAGSAFAADDDPFKRIVPPRPGDGACYRRVYDDAHLKKNPRQQTTEALLSFRYDSGGEHIERIRLTQRGRHAVLYFAGGCEWSRTRVNIDTGGNRMVDSYRRDAGYACIALTGPGSAQEGGLFLIDFAPDGNSLTLHLDSQIYAMRGEDGRSPGDTIDLGKDDRVFRMTRTDRDACRGLDEALPGLP